MNTTILARIFAITLFVLGIPPAGADESRHPVTLWEVKGDNNTVYLLGSIHLLRSGDYPLPTALSAAYDDAEVLVMEIDMDDLDPVAAQTAFTEYGILPGDQTLQSAMGAEMYAEAVAAAEDIGIPLDLLEKTDPWYAAMTIEIMMLGRIGFDPTLGVEMHMMTKAVGDGKPIEGLETAEQQVRILDGMSLRAQREMLLATLHESAKLGELMDEMIDAWRHGDIEFLETNMLDELAKTKELHDALVVDRNRRWVDQMDAMLDSDDDYLIIVGALHLIGDVGVPTLLSQRGFEVKQLSEPLPVR